MARVLVIGYGNPLRGDDGLGWEAAQRLAASNRNEDVHVLACHQLAPELAEPLSQAERVAFIDVCLDGLPGAVTCRPVEPASSLPFSFSHHLDPPALLAWVQGLYETCPEAVLFSVAGESLGYGEGLSSSLQAVLPTLLQGVQEWIAQGQRRNQLGGEKNSTD